MLPEIILAIEVVVSILVDWTFWGLFDKTHSLLGNDASVINDGLNDLV